MSRPSRYGVVARVPAVLMAALMVLLLSSCGSAQTTTQTRLPDATLKPLRENGTSADLRDLQGPAVVGLWANWCTQCRTELPIFEAFHRAHPDVKVLGVDWEDPARSKALAVADAAHLTYPLVVDAKPVLRAQGLPKMYLIDARGRIAYQGYPKIDSLATLERLVRRHLKVQP